MKKLLFFFLLLSSCNGAQESVTDTQHIVSNSLGVSFDLPASLETCAPEEYDASKETNTINDPGYTPKGFSLRIRCGDFYLDAVSPDFAPYEGMWALSTPKSTEELVKVFTDGNFVHYPFLLGASSVEVFIMDTFWNADPGETYWISAYLPTPTSAHYKVARFSLRLDSLPAYDDPNYAEAVQDYLQKKGSEKIQAFESILSSVKPL